MSQENDDFVTVKEVKPTFTATSVEKFFIKQSKGWSQEIGGAALPSGSSTVYKGGTKDSAKNITDTDKNNVIKEKSAKMLEAAELGMNEVKDSYIQKVKESDLYNTETIQNLKEGFPYALPIDPVSWKGVRSFITFCTDLVDAISFKAQSYEIENILTSIVGESSSKIIMSTMVPDVMDALKAQQNIITDLTQELKEAKKDIPTNAERPQVLFEDSPTILKIKKDIEDIITVESNITTSIEVLLQKDDTLEERIKMLEEQPKTSKVEIEIKQGKNVTKKEVDDTLPIIFEELVSLAINRINIMLVGPMGCGKSTTAMLLAKVLELPFGFLCASEGMSESMLEGWLLPTGEGGTIEYTPSTFITFYETGGVFLLDEFDAANANTLTVINSAIAGNAMALPKRKENPIVKKHPDFILLAAANTFGMGADRVYTARNQLDGATLDRFKLGTIIMDYDKGIESKIVDKKILTWGIRWRNKIRKAKMRREVSTRFLKDLSIMHTTCPALYGKEEKWEEVLFKGWSEDEKRKIQGA